MNAANPNVRLHWHPSRKHRPPVPNCPMPERDDDELPPCVGETMRDVLAERAISTLADNVEDAS